MSIVIHPKILKPLSTSLISALSLLAAYDAQALPAGGQIAAGSATITTNGNTLDVNQTSSRAVINWDSFNINSGQTVQFIQPSSSSIALNRVTGPGASLIDGALLANGNVWIINSNGVMFGNHARVNVGGLLASTSAITNSNFMAGHYSFTPGFNPNASVSNAGSITVADAGLLAFVAPNVSNSGVINAKLGNVTLASGDSFSVADLYSDGLISLQTGPSITAQSVSNSGKIFADGGVVTLTTGQASDVVNGIINMNGIIEADTSNSHEGTITISAANGNDNINVSGTLTANGGMNGNGGNISVKADGTLISLVPSKPKAARKAAMAVLSKLPATLLMQPAMSAPTLLSAIPACGRLILQISTF